LKHLIAGEELSKEQEKKGLMLGWCVELVRLLTNAYPYMHTYTRERGGGRRSMAHPKMRLQCVIIGLCLPHSC
jgi:hypothetical protein